MPHETSQRELPFGEAEGSFAERKELLGMALLKIRADIYLCQFVVWVFNATSGGVSGALQRSYDELAQAPFGLVCSKRKAQDTVSHALRMGLVGCTETRNSDGGRGTNCYWIDWAGVRQLVGLNVVPHGTGRHGGGTGRHGGGTACHALKENTFSKHSSESNERSKARMLSLASLDEHRQRIAEALDREGVWEVPELEAAREQRIAPLPPEALARDAFRPLKTEHLRDVVTLVRWFRRQLSLQRPLTGESKAELLLVLSTGITTAEVPANQVAKSRMGIFVTTIARGLWGKVLWNVPQADAELAKLLAAYPECLTHAEWPGPRADGQPEGEACRTKWRDGELIYTEGAKEP